MFLLCLLVAYFLIRLGEDINASVRGHVNPRHEYRMAKLAARQNNGGRVLPSSMGRYFTGLFDDAWDSAHERRQLMADHRAAKRTRRANRKIDRDRARWDRQDGIPPAEQPAAHVDPSAPARPEPIGFDVPAPQPANPPPADPTQSDPISPGDIPPPPWVPEPSAGPVVVPPPAPVPGQQLGFDVRAPHAADLDTVFWPGAGDAGVSSRRTPLGDSTRKLAEHLSERAAEINTDGLDAAVYPLTEQQQATVDAVRKAINTPGCTSIPAADVMALPVSVRADLLQEIGSNPHTSVVVPPGAEDVEALALLDARHGGTVNPADIYTHPDDASPEARAAATAEAAANQQPAADAAHQPAETSTDSTEGSVTADSATGSTASPTAGESGEDPGAERPAGDNPDAKEDHGPTSSDTTPNDPNNAAPNNVIPFQRSTNTTPTRMEFPVTTPTNTGTSTEVTGLASAIAYAKGLAKYGTETQDQVSAIVPTAEEAAVSCEQARENLCAGGVTGPALTEIAATQEQFISAAREVRTVLGTYEAASAAASALVATLTRHQQTVGEAYQANPDAGKREFVTAE